MPVLPSLRPATRAVLMLVASIGFWSSNVVIVRAMGDAISPWLLSWLRWVIALAVALPLLWPAVRAAWPRLYANRRPLLWLAFSGFVANTVFLYVGLSDTTATNAAALLSLTPAWIMLAVCLSGTRLMPVQLAGLALSIAGSLVIVTQGQLASLLALDFNRGDIFVIISGMAWAAYTLLLRRLRGRLHPMVLMVALMAISVVMLLPVAIGSLWLEGLPTLGPGGWTAVMYVGICLSLLAYAFYNRAVSELGGARAGAFMNLMPGLAALESAVFLGEAFLPYHMAGMALILGGLWLASSRQAARFAVRCLPRLHST
ncbi:DMT family transporter [Laribacter hongkongensis]|uniref:DMT family transporter n=1 Tax=Laribacter hongkongensis TaxID=168471 RepID=UPI001EFDEDC6|nr:DMT family transporter [Laribacter hongkongensis]MCG9063771.1 DMT family transporter [Laribacter hongkongensis]